MPPARPRTGAVRAPGSAAKQDLRGIRRGAGPRRGRRESPPTSPSDAELDELDRVVGPPGPGGRAAVAVAVGLAGRLDPEVGVEAGHPGDHRRPLADAPAERV